MIQSLLNRYRAGNKMEKSIMMKVEVDRSEIFVEPNPTINLGSIDGRKRHSSAARPSFPSDHQR